MSIYDLVYIVAIIGILIFVFMNRSVQKRRNQRRLSRKERLDKLIDTINEIKKKDQQ